MRAVAECICVAEKLLLTGEGRIACSFGDPGRALGRAVCSGNKLEGAMWTRRMLMSVPPQARRLRDNGGADERCEGVKLRESSPEKGRKKT